MGNAASVPPVPVVASLVDLGDVTLNNIAPYIGRDLGWSGSIGYTIINTYGDTSRATGTGYPSGRTGASFPFAANSASTGTNNVMEVTQYFNTMTNSDGTTSDNPPQFCPYFPDEDPESWGMGITAVSNIDNTLGVVYYLALRRGGDYPTQHYIGAGIGKVDNTITGYPTCTRLEHYDWDGQSEPTYGSQGAFSGNDPDTGAPYIYAIGNGNTTLTNGVDYVWITRVAQANALDINSYEYWTGSGWSSDRLIYPGATEAITSVDVNGKVGPMTDMGQASINWSPHYNAYLMMDVVADGIFDSHLRVRTSVHPQGPWGPVTIITNSGDTIPSTSQQATNGNIQLPPGFYAGCQQPWYDTTGKTLFLTYTYTASTQRVLQITWQ